MTTFQTIKSVLLAIALVLVLSSLLLAIGIAGSVVGTLLTLLMCIGVVYALVADHRRAARCRDKAR